MEQAMELLGDDQPTRLAEDENYLPADLYDFPDDDYDYEQHLKPIGGGKFIPATLVPVDPDSDFPPELEADVIDEDLPPELEADEEEILNELPEDVRELLLTEEDTGDLQDDFVILADEAGEFRPKPKNKDPFTNHRFEKV
jgi:hypothetical protein